MDRLKTVYKSGFWDGFYLGQTLGEWAGQHGSLATQRKEYVGKVTNYFRKLMVAEIQMESGFLKPGDAIYIQGPTTGSIDMIIPQVKDPISKEIVRILLDHPHMNISQLADEIKKRLGKLAPRLLPIFERTTDAVFRLLK